MSDFKANVFAMYTPRAELLPVLANRLSDSQRGLLFLLYRNLVGVGKRKLTPPESARHGLRLRDAHFHLTFQGRFVAVILTLGRSISNLEADFIEQYVGIARCCPEDEFSLAKGQEIALRRALRLWISTWEKGE